MYVERTAAVAATVIAVIVSVRAAAAPKMTPEQIAAKTAESNAAIAKVCANDTPRYDALIKASTKSGLSPPPVPEPPEIELPCAECGSGSGQGSDAQAASQAQADATADQFVQQASQPEADDIKFLLMILREVQTVSGAGGLSDANAKCIGHFAPSMIVTAIQNIIEYRLWRGKVVLMVNRYKTEYKRAYAGLKFLYFVENQKQMNYGAAQNLNGTTNESSAPPDTEALQLAASWATAALASLAKDIEAYHYNLCPGYLAFARMVVMAANSNDDSVQDMLAKIDKMLHFKLSIDVSTEARAKTGYISGSWHTENTLYLQPGSASCYTALLQKPSAAMQFRNTSWDYADDKGNKVPLVSPHQFTIPISAIHVTLCDQSPQIVIDFANGGQQENIQVGGHDAKAGIFGLAFGAMLQHDLIQAALDHNASNAGQQSPPPNIDQLKATIAAHANDVAWMMSDEGHAVILQMQNAALSQAGGVGKAIAAKNGNPLELRIEWSNNTATPVQKTLTLNKDGWTSKATITVQQQ